MKKPSLCLRLLALHHQPSIIVSLKQVGVLNKGIEYKCKGVKERWRALQLTSLLIGIAPRDKNIRMLSEFAWKRIYELPAVHFFSIQFKCIFCQFRQRSIQDVEAMTRLGRFPLLSNQKLQ
ncbi:MAG TPA: hypothetical protein DCP75_01215 [Haliea salexigens]|uniref:Uncharacterized protein n=1 Tax=Haliea salexigens TaxID=287487 RepID=A0A3C1KIT2_9GAMM|nr:hypothetical protein [Haliea sp.]HAN26358.1 hypothetical protein [Haliea salexigens]